jgi:peptidoglycan/xylan/chitin deacetylase (PgdA/CDA1 family)
MKKKSLIFGILCSFSVIFFAGILISSPQPGDFFAAGPRDGNRLALTFDDGPGPYTERFLDLLDKYGVKATFFMSGQQVKYRPHLAKMVAERGHEIGNHTREHINYLKHLKSLKKKYEDDPSGDQKALEQTKIDLAEDINGTQKRIKEKAGVKPWVVRMPHGIDRPWIKEVAKEQNVILVNWTHGADWSKESFETLEAGYLNATRPGAILLFHDGGSKRQKSLALVESVLKKISEKDYQAVTVSQLLGIGP